MGFMDSVGGHHDGNASHWWDQKYPSFTNQPMFGKGDVSENTNWKNAAVHMSVTKEAIRNATGRVNAPLECWKSTNFPRYHVERFKNYSN